MTKTHVLTREDLDLIETGKHLGMLIPIRPSTFVKREKVLYVLCNSGPELQDRLMFGWNNIAKEIFPVMTYGGIVRLSSQAMFFDQGVIKAIEKADQVLKLGNTPLVTEFHYPCRDICEIRALDFKNAFLHAIEGFSFATGTFGTNGREVILLSHFTHPDGSMETFLVDKIDDWTGLLSQ